MTPRLAGVNLLEVIKLCTVNDLPAVVSAESGIWDKLPLPGKFNPLHFENRLRGLLNAGVGVIVADFDESGVVTAAAGGALSLEFHTAEPIAQQIFWTANQKRRGSAAIRVLREFEKECRARGAKHLYLTHLFDGSAKRMSTAFKRWGFLPLQATYVKAL